MRHWEHFSGFKPAMEDFHFERDAKEAAIKDHVLDLTGNAVGGSGILKGITDEIQVYVDNPAQFLNCKVKAGAAYIRGEKVLISAIQTVNLTDVETEANIIWLKYKLIDSSDPNAVRYQYINGQPYVVWKVDSFELGATKESQYIQSISEIKLARVAKVSGQLVVTNDYRLYLKFNPECWPNYTPDSDFYVGGPAGTGRKVLVKQFAPPVPTRLTLSTGWDQIYRKNGEAAGLLSVRPAYIKIVFGDQGSGNASGNTFAWVTNRIGNWTTNEWADRYLTCSDGNSWKVVSNTSNTLTLEAAAVPVTGIFWLGPLAAGYKFILQILAPTDDTVQGTMEAEASAAESPVKMEYIWHGLTPDVKYSIKVASRGGWFQDEWSAFSAAQTITAGGTKVIPDNCASTVKDVVVAAEDDGIRISWDIDNVYVNDVAGLEIVWTDDGSDPDFDTLGHKKVFTDRKAIVIPSKHSTDLTNITVKAKLRAVDKAGRHCVTPISITPTIAKKYLGNIETYITELKTARGSAPSLNDRMSISLEPSGKNKSITEAETEMGDARAGFATIGERMTSFSLSNIDWEYTRVVAKNGTAYQTIQAAVNSVPDYTSGVPNKYEIWIMPGVYVERVSTVGKAFLMFRSFGAVLYGSINNDAALGDWQNIILMEGLRIINSSSGYDPFHYCGAATDKNEYLEVRNCAFINNATAVGDRAFYTLGPSKLLIKNCYMRASGDNSTAEIGVVVGTGKFKILHSEFQADSPNATTKAVITNASGCAYAKILHCIMNAASLAPAIRSSGTLIKMAHNSYTVAPAGAAGYDYGALNNISNVLFDAGDLLDFDEWTYTIPTP